MIPLEDRCDSLHRAILHRDGDHEVYLRCMKTAGHESPMHRSWLKSWHDDQEDGYLEDGNEEQEATG